MIVTFDSKKPSKSESKATIKSTNHEKSFLIENNDYKSFKSSKRSKNGCVTCKIRKKKCDELKPICLECKRLKKECIWVDYDNMNDEQIHEIKQLVEKVESNNKLRKRKRSLQHHNNLNNNNNMTTTNTNNNNTSNTTTRNANTNNTNNHHHNLTYVNSNIESNTPPDIQNLIDAAKDDFEMFNPLSPNNSSYSTELIPINYSSPSGANSPNQLLHSMSSSNVNDTTNNQLSLTTSGTFSPNDFFNYLKDINQEFLHDYNIISPQSPNFNQILNNFSNPSPKLNPSILATKLNDRSLELYNYYVNVLTPYISVAPRSHSNNVNENHYQTVFLPLAHQDDGVMNSILAWSSFHMNNHKSNKEGLQYLETALKHFHSKTSNERSTIINKLATMLVLLGAEICRGDVKNWLNYMEWGSKLLQSNGGLANFNLNKQEFWLISNFAYHDVLSSNTTERGTYFKMDQYKEIFSHDLTSGILNPLVGIAKDIYVIIGEISHLSFETNKNLKNLMDELNEKNVSDSPIYEVKQSIDESSGVSDDLAHDTTKHKLDDKQDKRGEEEIEVDVKPDLGVDIDGDVDNYSELSSHAKINNLLSSVIEKTKDLDRKIEEAKPNKEDLYGLNDQEFEWQITLFETFKLSSKLYLRQSIGKNNPSSLESQVLNNDLIKCLDIVLGSPVESVLVFPVFISAIHCITKLGRSNMLNRIDNYMKTYGPWSIIRAKEVIEKIWDINPDGDKVIDWHAILKDLGWEINFA